MRAFMRRVELCVVCDTAADDSYQGIPVHKECWRELLAECKGDAKEAFSRLRVMLEDH